MTVEVILVRDEKVEEPSVEAASLRLPVGHRPV